MQGCASRTFRILIGLHVFTMNMADPFLFLATEPSSSKVYVQQPTQLEEPAQQDVIPAD